MGQLLTRAISAATLAAVLSWPAAAATSTWQIDPNHSSAQFAVRHLGLSTVRGAFTKVNGTVQLDEKDIAKSSVEVTIEAASVDTRVEGRDKDLRSDHFFDVKSILR
jgi:polyisoprenoid-binding protein YceI